MIPYNTTIPSQQSITFLTDKLNNLIGANTWAYFAPEAGNNEIMVDVVNGNSTPYQPTSTFGRTIQLLFPKNIPKEYTEELSTNTSNYIIYDSNWNVTNNILTSNGTNSNACCMIPTANMEFQKTYVLTYTYLHRGGSGLRLHYPIANVANIINVILPTANGNNIIHLFGCDDIGNSTTLNLVAYQNTKCQISNISLKMITSPVIQFRDSRPTFRTDPRNIPVIRGNLNTKLSLHANNFTSDIISDNILKNNDFSAANNYGWAEVGVATTYANNTLTITNNNTYQGRLVQNPALYYGNVYLFSCKILNCSSLNSPRIQFGGDSSGNASANNKTGVAISSLCGNSYIRLCASVQPPANTYDIIANNAFCIYNTIAGSSAFVTLANANLFIVNPAYTLYTIGVTGIHKEPLGSLNYVNLVNNLRHISNYVDAYSYLLTPQLSQDLEKKLYSYLSRIIKIPRVNGLFNTGFANAASGTPGTAPTGWLLQANNGSIAVGVNPKELTFSTANGQCFIYLNSTYNPIYYTFRCKFSANVVDFTCTDPSTQFVTFSGGSRNITPPIQGNTITKGINTWTFISIGGAGNLRLGVGTSGNTSNTTSLTIKEPQLTIEVYQDPPYQEIGANTALLGFTAL